MTVLPVFPVVKQMSRTIALIAAGCMAFGHASLYAKSAGDFVGYWKDPDAEGVVQTYLCRSSKFSSEKNALCARIVWVKDAASKQGGVRRAEEDCNHQIMLLKKFDKGIWEDGFTYDVRDQKTWQIKIRLSEDLNTARVRRFLGDEHNGKTEYFTRVNGAQSTCKGAPPDKAAFGR